MNRFAVAAHAAATSPLNDRPLPSDAQRKAGNFPMGHERFAGLDITIEYPAGAVRSGVGPDGRRWARKLPAHYGYIKRTEGADGDQVDVYVGPRLSSDRVFVVDQLSQANGTFDEHKVLLGFPNQMAAMHAYRSNFKRGWKVGPVTAMSIDELKDWLASGDLASPARGTSRS